MHFLRSLSDSERWAWFAGETDVALPPRAASSGNDAGRVFFEMGLVFAVPLALAALFSAAFGA
ncbi:MAG: hypothetical protein WDM91_19040 [Rhizomicrobium sp.]